MSLSVRSEILGLFDNQLFDARCYGHNAVNLRQPIQTHLSLKPKGFCGYVNAFLEFT